MENGIIYNGKEYELILLPNSADACNECAIKRICNNFSNNSCICHIFKNVHDNFNKLCSFKLKENKMDLNLCKFEEIFPLVKRYSAVSRKSWNEDEFICKQIPADITSDIISKMQSLPTEVKELLSKLSCISYQDQIIKCNKTTGRISYYTPTGEDLFAEDWYLYNNK